DALGKVKERAIPALKNQPRASTGLWPATAGRVRFGYYAGPWCFSAFGLFHQFAAFLDGLLSLLRQRIAGTALPLPAERLLPVDGDGCVLALLPLLLRVQALPALSNPTRHS